MEDRVTPREARKFLATHPSPTPASSPPPPAAVRNPEVLRNPSPPWRRAESQPPRKKGSVGQEVKRWEAEDLNSHSFLKRCASATPAPSATDRRRSRQEAIHAREQVREAQQRVVALRGDSEADQLRARIRELEEERSDWLRDKDGDDSFEEGIDGPLDSRSSSDHRGGPQADKERHARKRARAKERKRIRNYDPKKGMPSLSPSGRLKSSPKQRRRRSKHSLSDSPPRKHRHRGRPSR